MVCGGRGRGRLPPPSRPPRTNLKYAPRDHLLPPLCPAELEFVVRESRNWFAHSPLTVRRLQYEDLHSAIRLSMMEPCQRSSCSLCRRDAWSKAIDTVLNQWLEVKTHFRNHFLSLKPSEKSAVGRKLHKCYQNESFHLFLLFLFGARVSFQLLLFFPFLYFSEAGSDHELLKNQWDLLTLTDWRHFFVGEVPSKSIDFWAEVMTYKHNNQFKFSKIASFALSVLSLPFQMQL